jgi:hypothetical protein
VVLGVDSTRVGSLFARSAVDVQGFCIYLFKVLFVADASDGNGKITVRTIKHKNMCISQGDAPDLVVLQRLLFETGAMSRRWRRCTLAYSG